MKTLYQIVVDNPIGTKFIHKDWEFGNFCILTNKSEEYFTLEYHTNGHINVVTNINLLNIKNSIHRSWKLSNSDIIKQRLGIK